MQRSHICIGKSVARISENSSSARSCSTIDSQLCLRGCPRVQEGSGADASRTQKREMRGQGSPENGRWDDGIIWEFGIFCVGRWRAGGEVRWAGSDVREEGSTSSLTILEDPHRLAGNPAFSDYGNYMRFARSMNLWYLTNICKEIDWM
jgi:hypothetical protein